MTYYISKTTHYDAQGTCRGASKFETASLERAVDASWGEHTERLDVPLDDLSLPAQENIRRAHGS